MPKLVAPVSLCLLALATSGCHMLRPPIQNSDQAWNTYKGRVAEQCSSKHPESISPEKLYDISHDYYFEADTQIQQIIEKDTRMACGKQTGAECFNTGVIQATIQAGSLNDFVKHVCSKT
jgi:hypothetical protein